MLEPTETPSNFDATSEVTFFPAGRTVLEAGQSYLGGYIGKFDNPTRNYAIALARDFALGQLLDRVRVERPHQARSIWRRHTAYYNSKRPASALKPAVAAGYDAWRKSGIELGWETGDAGGNANMMGEINLNPQYKGFNPDKPSRAIMRILAHEIAHLAQHDCCAEAVAAFPEQQALGRRCARMLRRLRDKLGEDPGLHSMGEMIMESYLYEIGAYRSTGTSLTRWNGQTLGNAAWGSIKSRVDQVKSGMNDEVHHALGIDTIKDFETVRTWVHAWFKRLRYLPDSEGRSARVHELSELGIDVSMAPFADSIRYTPKRTVSIERAFRRRLG